MNGDKFKPMQVQGVEMDKKYDEKKWGELTAREAAFYDTYQKGLDMGVPPEELERFAQGVVRQKTEEGDLGFVFRFRKAISLGTPEEIDKIGLSAYQQAMEQSNYEAAARLAKEIQGKESSAYLEALGKAKKQKELLEKEWSDVALDPDATFANLFEKLDAMEDRLAAEQMGLFESELADNFPDDIFDEIEELRNDSKKASETNVLRFFEERGYDKETIEAYLPIKFEKKTKQS